LGTLGFVGVTAIDTNAASSAVNVVDPETAPNVAVMVDVPLEATAMANPPDVIMATAGFEELQVTELVMSNDCPPEYWPVAVNCCVAPLGTLGLAGVTVID